MIARERRTYRFLEFARDSLAVLVRLPVILRGRLWRRVDKAFEEKLVLTVTAVNECRYCAWVHSREAVRCRIPPEEVTALLSGAIDRGVPADEVGGLLFAQHYAQSGRRPDPEAVVQLRETYGRRVADEIMLIVRVISLASLSGNTFRSFLERVRGRATGGSGACDEALVFLVTAPLFGTIGLMMRRAKTGRSHA